MQQQGRSSAIWRIAFIGLTACGLALAADSAPTAAPLAVAAQATPEAVAADATIEVTGLVKHPGRVSVATLQRLPPVVAVVTYQSGEGTENHKFTGVNLYDVLDHVGFDVDPDARNPLLHLYIVVTAKDGYQVVFSGGEIDPNFGHATILLAWEQDDQPLDEEYGPLRIVAAGDPHGGRYIYGIKSIDVRSIDEAAS